jgi:hypothetical protein
MVLTPRQARRSSQLWLWTAGGVALATLAFGIALRPFVQDPMPATWLSQGAAGSYIRRDSFLYYAYPLGAVAAWAVGLFLHRCAPRISAALAPLPSRCVFIVSIACSNIAILGWLRPNSFNAWLGLVYGALLLGLIANHVRAAHHLSKEPS